MNARTQELMKLNKEELVAMIVKLETSRGGRKGEVLALIQKGGYSIDAISGELEINNKNISSVLSGLRNDGLVFISYKINKETFIDYVGKRDAGTGMILNLNGDEVDARGVLV